MHREHPVNRCLSSFGQSACSASEYIHASYYDMRWELEYVEPQYGHQTPFQVGDLYLIKIKLLKGLGVWCHKLISIPHMTAVYSQGRQTKIHILVDVQQST